MMEIIIIIISKIISKIIFLKENNYFCFVNVETDPGYDNRILFIQLEEPVPK